MQLESHKEISVSNVDHDEQVHPLGLLIVLAKHKKFILSLVVLSAIGSAITSLLLTSVYTANTKLLPPHQSESVSASLLGQLGPLASLAGKDLGIRNPSDLYVTMLHSRTVSDSLIVRFSLMDVYKSRRRIDAAQRLDLLTEINSDKDGVISISVRDKSSKRAADLANAYVEELQRLTQSLAVTEAGRRRLFFEHELQAANQQLAAAEEQLKQTQQSTGVVQLDGQARAMIEALTNMRAQIAAKEIQIRSMSSFATVQNPNLLRAEEELAGMNAQLRKLESLQIGKRSSAIGVGKVTAAGMEYVRNLREVKYREFLLELLTKQYEAAHLDEAKDALLIQTLDRAIPPEIRSFPRRTVIVLRVTLITAFVSVILAFVMEAWEHAKSDEKFVSNLEVLKFYLLHSRKI